MKTIKNSSLWKMMVLLIVALSASVAVSSCSKDKDDDPSSSSSLVGTWYYMDEDGDFDYEDFFVFKSNGSFNYAGEDNGTYKFNEQTGTLTLKWDEYDVETLDVEFLAKNLVYIEDWGIYKKK